MKTKLLLIITLFFSTFLINAQDIGMLGDWSGWGDDVNMATTDNITYTLTGYYFPAGGLKFREDDAWTFNYGGDTFPDGSSTGGNIPVTAGFWDVSFNLSTLSYVFTSVTASDQNVSIIGDFNGWVDLGLSTTDNITYTATNVPLTIGGLKFRRDADWAVNYGGTALTGTGVALGGNIPILADGNYDISFNIDTFAYSIVESVLSTDDFETNLNVFYAENSLNIDGYQGKITIKVYDILGKLIVSKNNIQVSSSFATELNLPKKQLHIVVLEANNFKKVIKVISK